MMGRMVGIAAVAGALAYVVVRVMEGLADVSAVLGRGI